MRENKAQASNIILGDIFIIINALSYAFYLVWVKPLMTSYSALSVIKWVFTIALFIMLPMGINDIEKIDWNIFGVWDYMAVLFIIISVTFCTFLFNIYGIKILGSTITGAYIYSQPLFAAFISIVITGDNSNLLIKLLAAVLIFIGVYLVSVRKEKIEQA